ncbi:MAG TPA: hypothetical protein VGY55_25335 [Pirellulales bacterium]|jgi:hypothetical protein|nr:hypothetical protein [Pirellulales bacterium]
MRLSLDRWTLLLASAAVATGCTLPYESQHQHLAKFETTVQPATKVLPPAAMLHHPGPGVDGPGPGVFGVGAPPMMYGGQPDTSQIGFRGNDGMKIFWDVGGHGLFDSEPLVEPGRYNFPQGAIYRLKLTNIPGRPGVELYPTLELALATPRTEAFLAHNFIPFELTAEDFEQVLSGNFVTKVIYLPDAEHQEAVLAGAETLVSTRLEPGKDPIMEAERRGSIMAIIRIGNKDLQAPGAEGGNGIIQTGFHSPLLGTTGNCGPEGCGGGVPGGYQVAGGMPPGFVAGVTSPLYGMPITGTPIGLAGPPHVPLGVPAGLQEHIIANHTHMSIPDTTKRVKIDVKQEPGLSYPNPVHHVVIVEATHTPPVEYHQPLVDHHQEAPGVPDNCDNCGNCGPGH